MSRRSATGRIRIGVGGWTYEPWRGAFYPAGLTQKRELEYASRKLTSIEINGTFYGTQRATSFEKWHDETPEDFVFSLKAPRFATQRTHHGDGRIGRAWISEEGTRCLGRTCADVGRR